MMNSISSMKPISNIVSASSITRNLTQSKLTTPLSIKSINLPGVATNRLGFLLIDALCIFGDSPPHTLVIFNFLYLEIFLISLVT